MQQQQTDQEQLELSDDSAASSPVISIEEEDTVEIVAVNNNNKVLTSDLKSQISSISNQLAKPTTRKHSVDDDPEIVFQSSKKLKTGKETLVEASNNGTGLGIQRESSQLDIYSAPNDIFELHKELLSLPTSNSLFTEEDQLDAKLIDTNELIQLIESITPTNFNWYEQL
eukprot:TRINITY_DN28153_c0_g2_i1.p1 TRINITY_DN28153_c0_g2~~TRINITY_DN28153_c0_g2_i1.p1  ORF type:complete len:170 (-),score=37.68 TRINITY_DN28153_c0_g2_i1:27-536(-)